MTKETSTIIYTAIDEAPALATFSLLPILQTYTKGSGISLETRDISLSGRIIANFPDNLTEEQKIPDYLSQLGELATEAEANIVKLPNISASIPQLQEAIKELQEQGYDIPEYPEEAITDADKELQARFSKVLGSAVNPVLRLIRYKIGNWELGNLQPGQTRLETVHVPAKSARSSNSRRQ